MKRQRAHIPRDEELAAALLLYRDQDGKPWIPHEHAKLMTAAQIISLFHRDHYPVRHEDGGPDEAWNISWTPIMLHRHKTAKIDKPASAKGKRLRKIEAEHKAWMARVDDAFAKCAEDNRQRSRWPTGRKIPSRPFERRK